MKKDFHKMREVDREIKKALSRRKFLQGLAGAGGLSLIRNTAGFTAIDLLTRGVMSQALAAGSSIQPRTFVDIFIAGGFPAQHLYLILNPYANQSIAFTPWEGNNWVNGQMAHTTAALTVNGQTIQMPYLWGKTIPSRNGQMVPMSVLFKNSMFSQGYNFRVDSHEFGSIWTARPDPSTYSIHGVVGDASDPVSNPLPVVFGGDNGNLNTNFSSKQASMKNIPLVGGSNNSLIQLLGPVQADQTMRDMMSRRDTFSSLFQSALASIVQDVRLIRPRGADAISATVTGAENLVRRNFGNLVTEFENLRLKYEALIQRCTDMTQVFTSPISPSLTMTSGSSQVPNILRRLRQDSSATIYCNNSDLRTLIGSNTSVRHLAEGFALSEFLIRENLSKAINICVDEVLNVQVDGMAPQEMYFDQHTSGAPVALVLNAFTSRAIAACMYELQLRINELGKADDTFIKVGSEFTRAPDATQEGGDHGFEAQCFWGYSAAVKNPFVIGNTQRDASLTYPSTHYPGSWGRFAKVSHEGSPDTVLGVGHYASTICAALRVKTPVPNFQSVVQEDGANGIIPVIELAKIKDEP